MIVQTYQSKLVLRDSQGGGNLPGQAQPVPAGEYDA